MAWANANKTQYQWDTLGRQTYEQRYDWDNSAWSTRYDITQVYDQNGNRTGYDKNVAAGYTADYGKAYNLSYTFDSLNQLTAIMDSDDLYYSCSVTSDANMNITLLEEKDTRRGGATLYSYFEYDALNRMTAHKTKANLIAGSAQWWWTKRAHQYDAVGRLVRSTWKTWPDGQSEPGGNSLEHVYAGAKHAQNYDGTNYGRVWHWAGAQNEHMGPLDSPNADTASQQGYNVANGGVDVAGGAGGPAGGAGGMSPQKRTIISPTTEGDQRHLFGQGRPMAKDSSGSGSAWATGTVSRYTGASGYNVESRLMFDGTVAATDMSRATDVREKDRIGIFGTGLSYAGSYGRVTSESIGRDLNPLGRGAGQALVGGGFECGTILPSLPSSHSKYGIGTSVNNPTIEPVKPTPNADAELCTACLIRKTDKKMCWIHHCMNNNGEMLNCEFYREVTKANYVKKFTSKTCSQDCLDAAKAANKKAEKKDTPTYHERYHCVRASPKLILVLQRDYRYCTGSEQSPSCGNSNSPYCASKACLKNCKDGDVATSGYGSACFVCRK